MAQTPEDSPFTSIYQRIRTLETKTLTKRTGGSAVDAKLDVQLQGFLDEASPSEPVLETIPFRLRDYLSLIDWSGRSQAPGKRGAVDERLPSILKRLNIDPSAWLGAMGPSGNVFGRALGRLSHLQLHAKSLGQQWVRGLRQAERLYGR